MEYSISNGCFYIYHIFLFLLLIRCPIMVILIEIWEFLLVKIYYRLFYRQAGKYGDLGTRNWSPPLADALLYSNWWEQIMPTTQACPHQVLKAPGAPATQNSIIVTFFPNRHPWRQHRWCHRDLQHDVGKIVHSCFAMFIQCSNPSSTAVKLLPIDYVRWLYWGHLWHTQEMCTYHKVSWWNWPQRSLYPCHWLLYCRHQWYLQWTCSNA